MLVVVGVLVALLLAEGGLRLTHPALPSLAPLESMGAEARAAFERATSRADMASGCRPTRVARPPATIADTVGTGSGAPLTLLVAGDSVVHGFGVRRPEAWPVVLGEQWAAHTGRRVEVRRTGGNGTGMCQWVEDTHRVLDTGVMPDAAVLQLYADDLEVRGMVRLEGQVVALPGLGREDGLAWWTWRSYLVNRLWLAWVVHRGPDVPERFSDHLAAATIGAAIGGLGERFDAAGVPWTVVLVAPAGIHRCDDPETAPSDCAWLVPDLARMAGWVAQEGLPLIDLRPVWEAHPPDLLPQEAQSPQTPAHPGPSGHRALADAVAPWLTSAK